MWVHVNRQKCRDTEATLHWVLILDDKYLEVYMIASDRVVAINMNLTESGVLCTLLARALLEPQGEVCTFFEALLFSILTEDVKGFA